MSRKCLVFILLVILSSCIAYDPFQQNENAPFDGNLTKKFHPRESMSFAQVFLPASRFCLFWLHVLIEVSARFSLMGSVSSTQTQQI